MVLLVDHNHIQDLIIYQARQSAGANRESQSRPRNPDRTGQQIDLMA